MTRSGVRSALSIGKIPVIRVWFFGIEDEPRPGLIRVVSRAYHKGNLPNSKLTVHSACYVNLDFFGCAIRECL
jgi:hypothetical protein